MRRNAYYDALVAELNRIGATGHRVENGSKHKRLVFTWNGREFFYPFPYGSRNKSAGREAVKDLRHLLGVRPPSGKGCHRQRRHPAPVEPAPVQDTTAHLSLTLLPDPWQPLAEFRPLSKDPAVRAVQQRIEARVQLALFRLSFHPGPMARWKRDTNRAARRAARGRS